MVVARFLTPLLVLVLLTTAAVAQVPEQVHVGLGATVEDADASPPESTHLIVHWVVQTPYAPADTPVVEWTDEEGQTHSTPAQRIGHTDPPSGTGIFAKAQDGNMAEVYAARIMATRGQTISYSVGIPGAMSDTFNVTNTNINPMEPTRLIAIGKTYYDGYDTETGEPLPDENSDTEDVMDLVSTLGGDVIVHAGGMSTSGSSPQAWDTTFRIWEPVWGTVPMAVAPGTIDTGNDYEHIRNRFVHPIGDEGRLEGVTGNPVEDEVVAIDDVPRLYHGFHAGAAYVFTLDTPGLCRPVLEVPVLNDQPLPAEGPCPDGMAPDTQFLEWLHDSLEDLREDLLTPWVIVVAADSPFVYTDDRPGPEAQAFRELALPILEHFQVDLVVSSQDALYQRTYPLWNGVPTTTEASDYRQGIGPVHVATSGAGRSPSEPLNENWPPYLAAAHGDFHATTIDVTNETLTVRSVSVENATVMDEFTIHRSSSDGFLDAAALPVAVSDQEASLPVLPVALAMVLVAFLGRRRA